MARLGALGTTGQALVPIGVPIWGQGLNCCELQMLRKGYGGTVKQGWEPWGDVGQGSCSVPRAGAGLAQAPRGFLPGPLKNRWLVWRSMDLWISWAASPFHVAARKLS